MERSSLYFEAATKLDSPLFASSAILNRLLSLISPFHQTNPNDSFFSIVNKRSPGWPLILVTSKTNTFKLLPNNSTVIIFIFSTRQKYFQHVTRCWPRYIRLGFRSLGVWFKVSFCMILLQVNADLQLSTYSILTADKRFIFATPTYYKLTVRIRI